MNRHAVRESTQPTKGHRCSPFFAPKTNGTGSAAESAGMSIPFWWLTAKTTGSGQGARCSTSSRTPIPASTSRAQGRIHARNVFAPGRNAEWMTTPGLIVMTKKAATVTAHTKYNRVPSVRRIPVRTPCARVGAVVAVAMREGSAPAPVPAHWRTLPKAARRRFYLPLSPPSCPVPDALPYSHLAAGYDAVMAHVDYPGWARYVARLLGSHATDARDVVEIGCGTGSLTLALDALLTARLRGYDGAPAMVAEAQRKAARLGADVAFGVLGFHQPIPAPAADAVVLVYDGLNYLLEPREVAQLLANVRQSLTPGGVFVVDQSTPANSLNHAGEFDDEGETDAFSYVRAGHYDPATRLHTTTFELRAADGSVHREAHYQRAYTRDELAALIGSAGLEVLAAYDGFSTDPAGAESERIHWVLRNPA